MSNFDFIEEMTLPICHGCNLHIICKYPNTDDQKILCRFVDATDKLIFEEKVFDALSLSKVIRQCYKTLKENNTKHGYGFLTEEITDA